MLEIAHKMHQFALRSLLFHSVIIMSSLWRITRRISFNIYALIYGHNGRLCEHLMHTKYHPIASARWAISTRYNLLGFPIICHAYRHSILTETGKGASKHLHKSYTTLYASIDTLLHLYTFCARSMVVQTCTKPSRNNMNRKL